MTFYKKLFIFLLFALTSNQVSAQYDNLLPASSSGKPEVNANTGGIHHSLPLMTYNSLSLAMPLGLAYNSTGVRIDERSSEVGHNWGLTIGGKITRTIRDQRDPLENWDENYPATIDPNSQEGVDFFEAGEDEDRELDLFSFQFPGYSGSFVIGKDLKAIMTPYKPLKIIINTESYTPEPEPDPEPNGGWWGTSNQSPDPEPITIIESIKITTPQGITYTFGGDGAYETSTAWRINVFGGSTFDDTSPTEVLRTGWYLISIEDHYNDQISISYQEKARIFISGMYHKKSTWEMWDANHLAYKSNKIFENWATYNTPYIHEVTSNLTEAKLTFNYTELIGGSDTLDVLESVYYWPAAGVNTDKFNLIYLHSKGRAFLKEVNQTNGTGVLKAVYKFDYNDANGLPERSSFAQDHWGYYNGVTNNDVINEFVPKKMPNDLTGNERFDEYFEGKGADRNPNIVYAKKGLLSKVTYPTGAYKTYEYEANVENRVPSSPPGGEHPGDVDYKVTSCDPTVTDTETITASYDQIIQLPSDLGLGNQAKVSVYSYQTGDFIPGLHNKVIGANDIISFNAEIGKSFDVSLTSLSSGICVTIDPDFNGQEVPGNIEYAEVGGVRLKRVINHDPHSGQSNTTRFFYGPKHAPFHNSGLRQVKTDYYSYFYKDMHVGISGEPDWYVGYSIRSNSGNIQNSTNGGQVQYEHVTVSYGGDNFENGGVQYDYHVDFYEKPELIYGSFNVQDAPWSMTNWINGKLKTKEVFKYVNDHFVTLNRSSHTYAPVEIIDQYNGYAQVWTSHHRSIAKYKYKSLWSHLSSSSTTVYDELGNSPLTTTTNYNYDVSRHRFLTSKSTIDSHGLELTTTYKYPQDYSVSSGSALELMVQQNILMASPIETITYRNGVPIGAAAVGYEIMSEKVVPKYSYVAENTGQVITESVDGQNFPTPYHQESEVLAVDNMGQVESYITSSGIVTTVVRGVNGKYQLAVVQNATHQQVDAVLAQYSLESDVQLTPEIESALRSIPGARVSSQTYREGYGLTSKTDVNGRSQYYEYNDKGELKFIKDHDENVLAKQINNIKN